MMDKDKIMKYYQTDIKKMPCGSWKEFLERMKKALTKEYPADYRRNDPISKRGQKTIKEFKGLIAGLLGSPSQMEFQLTILEDLIMDFLIPYTRQLLIERINKRCEEREYLTKKENIEEIL